MSFRMSLFSRQFTSSGKILVLIALPLAACGLGGNQPISFQDQVAVGEHFVEVGEYDRAYRLLDGISEEQGNSVPVQIEVAEAYLRANALLRAQQAFGKVERLGDDEAANIGYGKIALRRNDPVKAQEFFAKVLAKNKEDPELFNVVGVAYDMQGIHHLAQKSYRLALHLDADHQEAWNNLGLSTLLSGNALGAVEMLSDLTESRLDDQTTRVNLGLALATAGHKKSAHQLLEHEMSNDDAEALFVAVRNYRSRTNL